MKPSVVCSDNRQTRTFFFVSIILLLSSLHCFPAESLAVSGNEVAVGETVSGQETPFARSELIASAKSVREGEPIEYTVIIRLAVTEYPKHIRLDFLYGPSVALFAAASPEWELDVDEDEDKKLIISSSKELSWQGEVTPGQDLRFTIKLVTLPDSSSSGILISNVRISWGGIREGITSETRIDSKIQPALYVLPGGTEIGVGMVILGYIIFIPLLTVAISWTVLLLERWRKPPESGLERKNGLEAKIFLYGISFAFAGLLGVAHLMGSIAHEDVRRYTSYQKTDCTLLDKTIIRKRGSSGSSSRGMSSSSTYNYPMVSVRYLVDGREIVAAGPLEKTSLHSTKDEPALRQLAQFKRGGVYPCWYDPQNPSKFVLARGVSWVWYLIGFGPLILLYLAGRYLLRRIIGRT